MASDPHIWKGKVIATIGDLFNAVAALETPEEGEQFIREYIEVLATSDQDSVAADPEMAALSNVGYVAGYGDRETAERIHRLTGASHPVYGTFTNDNEGA